MTICCLTVLIATVGCAEKGSLTGVYPAEGTITLDGQPLEGAAINLIPDSTGSDKRGASALSEAGGIFKLSTLKTGDGAFPGTYKVTVTKMVIEDPLTEEEKAESLGGKRVRDVVSVNQLPQKYASTQFTDLTLTIEATKNNNLKLELVSE